MKKLVTLCLLGVLSTAWFAPSAPAMTQFRTAFKKKYVDNGPSGLKEAYNKASCLLCHAKGTDKTQRNAYGEELSKLIEGDAQQRMKDAGPKRKEELEKILAELDKAFTEVAKMKSPTGDTYGERIGAGQLPVDPE
jgi:hypothetical protein